VVATATAASANWTNGLLASPYGMPVGIELYTVRREMAEDAPGTIEKLSKIGFKEVEIVHFGASVGNAKKSLYGMSGKEFAKLLSDNGLRAPSGHYTVEDITTDWAEAIEQAHDVGLEYMTNAWINEEDRFSLESWKRLVDLFNKAAEPVQKAGMIYNYHNHNFEFLTIDNTVVYDYLTKNLDSKIHFTLDCYWATHAGQDPVELIKARPGRVSILHIKDMPKGLAPTVYYDAMQGHFVEAGRGVIEWEKIFKAAPIGGVRHFYYEQDYCERPALESSRLSFEPRQQNLWVVSGSGSRPSV
jgi:sugar phosphate isomerase/epimerase